MSTRKDIITKGRYNVWDIKDLLIIILFITFLGMGAFLFTSQELQQYSFYVLGAGLITLIYIIVRILFRGKFHVSRFNIVWKTTVGSMHSVAYDQIGNTYLEYSEKGNASWLIVDAQGKKTKKFRAISPLPSAGVGILYFRYKDILPEVVFDYWNAEKKGKRTYDLIHFKIKIEGTLVTESQGSIVLYDKRILFIPTSEAQSISEPEVSAIRKAGFSFDKGKFPPDSNIKTHTLIEATLESNLPEHIRDSYIERIAKDNGGQVFANMIRNGKQWQVFNEGVEILIERP